MIILTWKRLVMTYIFLFLINNNTFSCMTRSICSETHTTHLVLPIIDGKSAINWSWTKKTLSLIVIFIRPTSTPSPQQLLNNFKAKVRVQVELLWPRVDTNNDTHFEKDDMHHILTDYDDDSRLNYLYVINVYSWCFCNFA